MNITDVYWIDKEGDKQRKLVTDTPVTLFVELKDFVPGSNVAFSFKCRKDDDGEDADFSGIVDEDGIVKIEDFQLKLKDDSNGNL
jgi:hypothetical protein